MYRRGRPSRYLRRAVARCESLETRRLLHTGAEEGGVGALHFDNLNINFQPTSAPVPTNFRTDGGASYGLRANGYTYGWNADNTKNVFDRNSSRSPDTQHDDGIYTQNGGNKTWELAVLNGTYHVVVVAGDPWVSTGVEKFVVEGSTAINGSQTTSQPWLTGSVDVSVTDGELTIANGSGAANGRLAYIQITMTGAIDEPTTTPYTGTPAKLPGRLQAENFDADDGLRITTYDTTAGNKGGYYRVDSDVDLYSSGDADNGYAVGNTQAKEWLSYTVDVQTTGTYNIDFRVRSGGSGGTFHLAVDGVDKTGAMALNNTGSWTTWATVRKTGVTLTAGTHLMKLMFDSAKVTGQDIGDVNYIDFSLTNGNTGGTTLAWTSKQAIPQGRYEAAGAMVNGKLYVIGGYYNTAIDATPRVDAYDVATNTWTRKRDMPETLTHAGQVVDGSFIYLVGGFLGDHPGKGVTSFWKYDTRNDTWTKGPDLPAPRGAGALSIVGQKLYYVGGLTEAQFATVNQGEMWTLDLNNPSAGWQARASLPQPRDHISAVSLNNKIYVMGGENLWDEFSGNTSRMDVYDYATNTWSVAASLPQPRGHTLASALTYNGQIYLIGGNTNAVKVGIQQPVSDVTRYNPGTNTWTAMTPMPAPRMSPVAGIWNGRLYVTTGSVANLNAQLSTWSATLP